MADALDIVLLRTVVAIDECGGFGRAAAALRLSQPTVSQHVRALEKRLHQTLVERDGRQARFTRAGESLLVEARRILAVHDDALGRLDAAASRGLVVGSTETAAGQILPELLATLRRTFPTEPLQFQIDRSTRMTDAVARGAIDLAIVLDTGTSAPGVEVGSLPLDWYTAPDWSMPAEERAVPLVAYAEPCGMRQRALRELGALGRRIEIAAESGSIEGVMAAARAGLGLAVLPTAGPTPVGLEVRHDLPALGRISVRLLSRRGLPADLEATAVAALGGFFAARREPRRIPA